jgi:hypothetical protein
MKEKISYEKSKRKKICNQSNEYISGAVNNVISNQLKEIF